MAKLLSLFSLQLLFGVFWPNLLEIASADDLSVHPGGSITLRCHITNYSEMSWYRLRAEEVKLLLSAVKGNLKKKFFLSYTVNESHFDITESSSSVSLVIIGVRETDLGFYYCGARNKTTHIQFGKPIRLSFTEDQHRATDNSSEPLLTPQSKGSELWIIMCVCLCVSVLINLIFIYMLCCRLKELGCYATTNYSKKRKKISFEGKSVPSCSCCSNTTDSDEKEENVHYASVQHKTRSGAAAKKNTASDSDSVTYATVASQPRRH